MTNLRYCEKLQKFKIISQPDHFCLMLKMNDKVRVKTKMWNDNNIEIQFVGASLDR